MAGVRVALVSGQHSRVVCSDFCGFLMRIIRPIAALAAAGLTLVGCTSGGSGSSAASTHQTGGISPGFKMMVYMCTGDRAVDGEFGNCAGPVTASQSAAIVSALQADTHVLSATVRSRQQNLNDFKAAYPDRPVTATPASSVLVVIDGPTSYDAVERDVKHLAGVDHVVKVGMAWTNSAGSEPTSGSPSPNEPPSSSGAALGSRVTSVTPGIACAILQPGDAAKALQAPATPIDQGVAIPINASLCEYSAGTSGLAQLELETPAEMSAARDGCSAGTISEPRDISPDAIACQQSDGGYVEWSVGNIRFLFSVHGSTSSRPALDFVRSLHWP